MIVRWNVVYLSSSVEYGSFFGNAVQSAVLRSTIDHIQIPRPMHFIVSSLSDRLWVVSGTVHVFKRLFKRLILSMPYLTLAITSTPATVLVFSPSRHAPPVYTRSTLALCAAFERNPVFSALALKPKQGGAAGLKISWTRSCVQVVQVREPLNVLCLKYFGPFHVAKRAG